MSTTIDTPAEDQPCAYCGSRIFDHDPICLRDCTADCGAPSYFCNHACLSAYIEENELTYATRASGRRSESPQRSGLEQPLAREPDEGVM